MAGARVGRGRVGGASSAGGVGYQEGVTAWLAVHLLVEEHAPPLPSFAAGVRVVRTMSETGQPIDDINAETATGPSIFVQAKRAVRQLVNRDGSDFTDFVGQAVDQHLALRAAGRPGAMYILATSPDAATSVRRELRIVLDRLRDAPPTAALAIVGATDAQRTALDTTAGTVRRLLAARGEAAADDQVREILERLVVWDLDVDGAARETSITLLAAAVVTPGSGAAAAWRTLEQRALRAAQDHDVLDLHGWRRALQMEGIELRAIPSLEGDVERLRRESARALGDLERHRMLRVAGTDLTVQRDAGEAVFRNAVDGPILVVGEPGSGKSGVLADVATRLRLAGTEVVILDADATRAASLGDLSRELRLDHDIGEVLEAWPGLGPRYLVIDSLDETRGTPSTAALRRLVERLTARASWVPVVAVRRFDLRYSSELRRMFAGADTDARWTDAEFSGTRHVVVGDLVETELDQLRSAAPALVAMADDPGVGPLLRRPIHLQLAADILARGGAEADVAVLRTQVQLLDLYWTRIVEEPIVRRAARERVLTAASTIAVSGRRLAFPRAELDAVDAVAATDLLGVGILVEAEAQPGSGRLVRFLHGLIADYAIARLVLGPPGAAEALLVGDPVTALFLRPSLELWLAGLWGSDPRRVRFWDVCLALCARAGVPEIARLVGPAIAAEAWSVNEDLTALLDALSDGRREAALVALRHLIGSLAAPRHPPVGGDDAGPWSALAVRLTQRLAPDSVFPARLLLMLLTDAQADLTDRQLEELGEAARTLLAWLWDHDNPDMTAARFAIGAVCASFSSDPAASGALLRRGLRRRHAGRRGYEELRHYAGRLEDLEQDPDLVVALYTAAFAFEHTDPDEPGVNLGGPVLSLVSSRDQEFRMVRYELARQFAGLMARDPETATVTLMRVLRISSSLRRHRFASGQYVHFEAVGVDTRVRDEWSAHTIGWLSAPGDEATLIADWSSELASLAVADIGRLRATLLAFLRTNRIYAGWRILLHAATANAALLPPIVPLLASAPVVLSAESLRGVLCRLLAASRSQPEVASELRAALEAPGVQTDARTSLLECLASSMSPVVPQDDEEADSDEGTDADAGIVPDASSPRRVLEGWLAEPPSERIPQQVLEAFDQHVANLGPHEAADEENWLLATRAGERLAALDSDCANAHSKQVASVFLRALHPATTPEDRSWDSDDAVETIPSHGCVLYAVDGIVRLRASGHCADIVPIAAVMAVAEHPLPWARSQLARVAGRLLQREGDLAWAILEKLAGDRVPRVAGDAVSIAARIRLADPDRARRVLARALEAHGTSSSVVTEAAVSIEGFLAVDGAQGVDGFVELIGKVERISSAAPLLHRLRSLIAPPPLASDGAGVEAHGIALSLLRAVASVAVLRYRDAAGRWEETRSQPDLDLAKDATIALDAVVSELYFASGAYRGRDDGPQPSREQMALFFDEVRDDLRGLLPDLQARDVHHVVEIAAANVGARPDDALVLIAEAIRMSRSGYTMDGLAKDLVLELIRSYMADRADLFIGSSEPALRMQTALVTILDSFVEVGWPEAREMAYHLHEVLR